MNKQIEVFVKPEDVWNYFQSRLEALRENSVDILAQCQIGDSSLQVCITEHKGFPKVTIELDDSVLNKEFAVNPADCLNVSRLTYSMFEDYCDFPESLIGEEEEEELDAFREAEIIEATKEFLGNLFDIPEDELEDEEMLSQIINDIESLLYDEYGLVIER